MTDLVERFNLQTGTIIRAQVKSKNDHGTSSASPESTGGILAQTKPVAAPTNIQGSSTTTSVTLTWTQVLLNTETGYSTVTGYKIYRKGPTDLAYIFV